MLCIAYKFIGSPRFMTRSLSNLVNDRSEWIHKVKCKYRDIDEKNVKLVELHINILYKYRTRMFTL